MRSGERRERGCEGRMSKSVGSGGVMEEKRESGRGV